LLQSLFVWLVADGWCWFILREKYCWLVAGGWFVVRQKYCWLVADKPSEQGEPNCTTPCKLLDIAILLMLIGSTFYNLLLCFP
jgi:hypothetical protein